MHPSVFCALVIASCVSVAVGSPYSSLQARIFSKSTPYKNHIISGFAPDPSCIRIQDQYFCVTSSFSAFPGIPVYTSKDLVQWEQIGNVVARPEQVPGLGNISNPTGGMWAATIRHHENTFYVTTTLVFDNAPPLDASRWVNMIFTNNDIWSNNGNGWSDPVYFSFDGYDTSLFWDDDGKVYCQGSHSWRDFPAIQQFEIDLATGKSLSGDPVTLWTGTGGLAPEGPHLYKKDGWYYLLIAEGGTGLNHMVTMARAKSIMGPYTPCPYNPVLTNANTTEYLQTVGHADVFQDTSGNWWAVSLATRNATVNYPMGRETVLVPVVWEKDQFPIFNGGKPGRVHINMEGPLPPKQPPTNPETQLVGHSQAVAFSQAPLPRQLVYYRYPDFSKFSVSPPGHPGTLRIMGSSENITGSINGGGLNGTSTFVSRRQDQVEFDATVQLTFDPKVVGEEAGVTLFIQRKQHFDMGIVRIADGHGGKIIRLRTITGTSSSFGDVDPISRPGNISIPDNMTQVLFKVAAVSKEWYVFSFADATEHQPKWTVVGMGAASEVSGGFTGTLVGMYATGNGKDSTSPAYFRDWDYVVNYEVS